VIYSLFSFRLPSGWTFLQWCSAFQWTSIISFTTLSLSSTSTICWWQFCWRFNLHFRQIFFFKSFFGVPHLATFIFVIFVYVKASIAYIHPAYGAGVWTHDLLIMNPLPLPPDHGSHLISGRDRHRDRGTERQTERRHAF